MPDIKCQPTAGGGSSFDPASPGPIGGTTPSTGAFTGLIASVRASASEIIVRSGSNDFIGLSSLSPAGSFCFYDPSNISLLVNFIIPDANTLALRNGTNGQIYIVSRTYTDGSNYSQLKISATGSAVAFSADEAGTGVGTLTSFTFDKPVLASNIIVADTGWTANADAGDKTKVIPVASSIVTIAAALDLAVAGAGTLLLAVAEKCKSLETALVAVKRPNA